MFRICLAACLAACAFVGSARAEAIVEQGYFVGCDADWTCLFVASGFRFYVRDDGTTDPAMIDELAAWEPMTAMAFEGEILSMGDISAEFSLTALAPVEDDLLQDTLRALQGDWQPDGEETPFFVRIEGLEWQDVTPPDEVQAAYLISAGISCADGMEPGGPTLVLYQLGGDPEAVACWLVQYVSDTVLELQDVQGDWGLVTYTRLY